MAERDHLHEDPAPDRGTHRRIAHSAHLGVHRDDPLGDENRAEFEEWLARRNG